MIPENQHFDRKSLRKVTGQTTAWSELALVCVGFANAQGGSLLIGIEDDQQAPPPGQAIPFGLHEAVAKRMRELTVNVELVADVVKADNDAEYIDLRVARAHSPASTADGRYAVRVGDECKPLVGDDVMRLLNDRPARPWELLPVAGLARGDLDADKCAAFVAAVRVSARVKDSVKEKAADELFDHYDFTAGDAVTHLGALLLGRRQDRARLGTAPVVQCLKFDEHGNKVNKWVWDDHSLSPVELVDAVWQACPTSSKATSCPKACTGAAYRPSTTRYCESCWSMRSCTGPTRSAVTSS
jgi:ATP-dependent DNA helicase RecG